MHERWSYMDQSSGSSKKLLCLSDEGSKRGDAGGLLWSCHKEPWGKQGSGSSGSLLRWLPRVPWLMSTLSEAGGGTASRETAENSKVNVKAVVTFVLVPFQYKQVTVLILIFHSLLCDLAIINSSFKLNKDVHRNFLLHLFCFNWSSTVLHCHVGKLGQINSRVVHPSYFNFVPWRKWVVQGNSTQCNLNSHPQAI